MRKKMEWNWEMLDEQTARAKVIGGWVLNHNFSKDLKGKCEAQCESMIFIADRDHEWTIVQPVVESKSAASKVSSSDFEASK